MVSAIPDQFWVTSEAVSPPWRLSCRATLSLVLSDDGPAAQALWLVPECSSPLANLSGPDGKYTFQGPLVRAR